MTVFWDRDGTGVISPGDYTNFYQLFTTFANDIDGKINNILNLVASDDHTSYPPPLFYTAVVYHVKQPLPPNGTGNWNTLIAAQLTGPSPDDVTITVTGPGGEYTLTPGVVIHEKDLVYTTTVPWLPNGDYTFTAVDSLGRKTKTTYHYEARSDLPSIASLSPTNFSYVGLAAPTLSWPKPADGYAYQVWIMDPNNSAAVWYVSGVTTDASVTIPVGVLLPDTAYRWFVRLCDRVNNPMNYTMSPIYAFYTGAYAAVPAFSSDSMGSRPPTGANPNYSNWADIWVSGVAPWDITGWRIRDGVGNVLGSGTGSLPLYIRPNDSFFEGGFSRSTPSSSGNYTFEMDINRSGTLTLVKSGIPYIFQNVQAVDVTSLVPSKNYYFKTSSPTFSWRAVADMGTYYRIRIFDPLGETVLWQSPWSGETSATVPAGVLTPGGTYYWTVMTTPAINPSYVSAYVNTEGSMSNRVMYRFTLQPPVTGDVSGNGEVNLADAILALQVVSGFKPAVTLPRKVTTDNRIGLPEAIYILQEVSGLR